ncbi:hypothetical protein P5V15_006166 [Pogonomyrmex californicus]
MLTRFRCKVFLPVDIGINRLISGRKAYGLKIEDENKKRERNEYQELKKSRKRNGSFFGSKCRTDASTATQKGRRCKHFGMREKVIYTDVSEEELDIKREREKKRKFISLVGLQTRNRDNVMQIVPREIYEYGLNEKLNNQNKEKSSQLL